MMVSLGAALMTLVSSYGFLSIVGAAGVSVDVSRVAASIAAGIGFLGAGVIFVHRGGVVGLTTAAGLWTTTGVGMAIGCGMYAPSITATALMLIAQVLLRGVERREKMQVTELVVGLTDGKGDLVRLYDWLAQRKITVREIDLKRQEGNSVKSCCTLPCRGISIKRISCGCRRISRVCSRLRYKRNSKAVRQKCRMAFVLDE